MDDLKTQLASVADLTAEKVPGALLNIAQSVESGAANGQSQTMAELLVPELVKALGQDAGTAKERLALGETLGRLGDPRIRWPVEDDYWVTVPYEASTIQIGRFPVTNREYRAWVDAGGYTDRPAWSDEGWAWLQDTSDPWHVNASQDGVEAFIVDNQPVVGVSHWEAGAFARANRARLPRFDERKWVTRGKERRPYPWGSPFGEGNANTQEEVLGRPCAVGLYLRDRTPEGVCDLAGNVAEWTGDEVGELRVVHPGAWDQPSMAAWAKAIELKGPGDRGAALGFRLARD